MPTYFANITEFKGAAGESEGKPLVSGTYDNFKQLELALERGLKASVIPRKKKKARAKQAKK